MKAGTEDRKKVAALSVLGVIAAYLFYSNVLSDPAGSSPAPKSAAKTAAVATRPQEPTIARPAAPAQTPNIRRANPGRINKGDEFHPVLRSKRPEEQIDPMTVDPTLRLDLLAKVQGVEPDTGKRNIFGFGQPPAATPTAAAIKGPEPIVKVSRVYGPALPPPKAEPPKEAPPPPPPPIPLKYYGYSVSRNGGAKTAFFLDGEDILVAPEGGMVKKRYKVVRIGVDSVLMEDSSYSNRQQSLPLQQEVGA